MTAARVARFAVVLLAPLLPVGGVSPAAGQTAVNLGAKAACDGLSLAQCCAQTLATHNYRVTRAPLARRPRLVTKLLCQSAVRASEQGKPRALSPKACESLLTAKSRPVSEARSRCRVATVAKRCERSEACRACVASMTQLGFAGAEPACWAMTDRPASERRRNKVVLGPRSSDGEGAVIRTQRVLQ